MFSSRSCRPAAAAAAAVSPLRRRHFSVGTVVVGVSGGVDSCVTLALMQQQQQRQQQQKRQRVVAAFMRNWDAQDSDQQQQSCLADRELDDVRAVCNQLDVPLLELAFIREYWTQVFQPFLDGLDQGVTPNPDVHCNRHIKFGALLRAVQDRFGQDTQLCTGHYARLTDYRRQHARNDDDGGGGCSSVLLSRPADLVNDQTYFLASVPRSVFQSGSVCFPLADYCKAEVRSMAEQFGLPPTICRKKTSVGLCFVGKQRDFGQFVGEYTALDPGPVRLIDEPQQPVVGKHSGYQTLTIGQRYRTGGLSERHWVCAKDAASNTVYVCKGADHPALFQRRVAVHSVNWLCDGNDDDGGFAIRRGARVQAQTRYRQPASPCTLVAVDRAQARITVEFDEPQRALTPGQQLVMYDVATNTHCLGSGQIV